MSQSIHHRYALLDSGYPEHERLPREFVAEFEQRTDEIGRKRVRLLVDGLLVGHELGDNHYVDDGYRFHDVFHLAHAAVLGWSPLLRSLLGRKRKSDPVIDDVEDGGRAIMLEEAISALTFDYAQARDWLVGHDEVDPQLLSLFRSLTSHLEVRKCSASDWTRTVLRGVSVWRQVHEEEGGRISIHLPSRTIRVISEGTLRASG